MNFIRRYTPGLLLFFLFAVLSVFTFKDYGVSWDEPVTREMGYVYYDYVFNGDHKLPTYVDRDHGSGFELFLILFEQPFHYADTKGIYQMRHLVTHLFFLFSAFCGYLLFLKLSRKQMVACVGFLLFVLQPRLYAHSFFNSKDIPFTSMFMISIALSYMAFTTQKAKWYLLLGAACGFTCSIRMPGILLPVVLAAVIGIDIVIALLNRKSIIHPTLLFAFFITSFCATFILFWPTLWGSPVHNFAECYGMMSHFVRWQGDILFNGILYKGTNLPWIYVPEWFCISTPIIWLLAGFAGTALTLTVFIRKPVIGIQNNQTRFYLICIALFLLPVVMVIFLNSVVYDDWRHLYFISAPFAVLGVHAIDRLLAYRTKLLTITLCGLQIVLVACFMIGNHPFQSVYLNEFVSRKKDHIKNNLEMDYWAVSQKQGLAYIVAHDSAPVIRVAFHPALDNSIMLLNEQDRKRIVRVSTNENPDYFVATYRNTHPDDHEYHNISMEINVLNSTIMRIYKLH